MTSLKINSFSLTLLLLSFIIPHAHATPITDTVIVGDKECEELGVTPRLRSGQNLPFMQVKELIVRIDEECKQRRESP